MKVNAPIDKLSTKGFIPIRINHPIKAYNPKDKFSDLRSGENLNTNPTTANPQIIPKIVQPQTPFIPMSVTGV